MEDNREAEIYILFYLLQMLQVCAFCFPSLTVSLLFQTLFMVFGEEGCGCFLILLGFRKAPLYGRLIDDKTAVKRQLH